MALAPSARAASCRPVTVDRGGNAGEEGAFRIRTTHVDCKTARRVLRTYLKTGDPPGAWKERREPPAFVLERGSRQITFRVAS
jgi:hypothetical protein